MRRLWWAWFLGAALTACGCQGSVVYVPKPEDPPAPPVTPPGPVTPPVTPPGPVTPPTPPPATVTEALARLQTGQTVEEASQALGAPAALIPASEGALAQARWFVGTAPDRWMVLVTLDAAGKIVGKGSAKLEDVR